MDGVFISYRDLEGLEIGEALYVNMTYFEMLKRWSDAVILRVTKPNGVIFTLRLKCTHNVKVCNNGLVRTVMIRRPI